MHITIIAYFNNSVTDSSKLFSYLSSFKEFNSLVITPFFTKIHDPPWSLFFLQKALASVK
jgi:hypothetical protein